MRERRGERMNHCRSRMCDACQRGLDMSRLIQGLPVTPEVGEVLKAAIDVVKHSDAVSLAELRVAVGTLKVRK